MPNSAYSRIAATCGKRAYLTPAGWNFEVAVELLAGVSDG